MINKYLDYLQEGVIGCSFNCAKLLGTKALKTYDNQQGTVGMTLGGSMVVGVTLQGAHEPLKALCYNKCRLSQVTNPNKRKKILANIKKYNTECNYWIKKFKSKGNIKGAKIIEHLVKKINRKYYKG